MKGSLFSFLIGIAAFYLSMTTVVFFKQRSLLYQPSHNGLPAAHANALSLKKWPDEANYRGYLSDPPNSELTVVVFHGNAGEAANRLYYVSALAAVNARVILAEYPGYGNRSGDRSETSFVSDARTTLDLVAKVYPNEPLIVIGESLGAGVASAAVGNHKDNTDFDSSTIQGLVLITPWDSLANVAQEYYWYLPARWLLLDRYDSVRNLQSFNAPLAVVLAGQDQIIPVVHANTLYNAIPSIKARFDIEPAGHNNWLKYVDEGWWQELMRFVTSEGLGTSNI